MERKEIIAAFKSVEDKKGLLHLINQIKESSMYNPEDFRPFTMAKLSAYSNPSYRPERRVHQFTIKKKSGGVRTISAPSYILMSFLYQVEDILNAIYTPKDCVKGFCANRSVVDNAICHTGKNYVLNLDLKDFFTSISQARVWKRLQCKPYCMKEDVANVIAGLCCMQYKEEDGNIRYVLPQGAPTSPVLTNMICERLDRKLMGLARKFNVTYSRYADDMTFSSMHNVYADDGEFMTELRSIISGQGFTLNEDKTRLQKRGERQEVTGLIVNSKVNVSRKYVREIRDILYMWEKYGYNEAYSKFYPYYIKHKGHVKTDTPTLENVIGGKLLYLKMVKGAKDPVYMRLNEQFQRLVEPVNDSYIGKRTDDIHYIASFTIDEFEHKFGIRLAIKADAKGKVTFSAPSGIGYVSEEVSRKLLAKFYREVTADDESGKKGQNSRKTVLKPKGEFKDLQGWDTYVCETDDLGNKITKLGTFKKKYHISLCECENQRFWLMMCDVPTGLKIMEGVTIDDMLDIWEKSGFDALEPVVDDGTFDFIIFDK